MTTVESSPAAPDPDHDLVVAARAGQNEAFDALVLRHQDRIVRLARRLVGDAEDALDAAQVSFVKAWRALPRFQGESRFSTWLVRIAINQCRNVLRGRGAQKRARAVSLDAEQGSTGATLGLTLAASGFEPSVDVEGSELKTALADALAGLEPTGREVLLLAEVERFSYEDIAAILDVAVGTVRSRLSRARASLRDALVERGLLVARA